MALDLNQRHRFVVSRQDWIEIELVDDTGAPVPDVEYQIELPGGETETGRLDENGFARHETKRSGMAKVTFLDLGEEALVHTPLTAVVRDSEAEWLEIALSDEAGKPVGKVAYRVELDGAVIEEGELGEGGTARVEGLSSSATYRVVFPTLDAGDFVEGDDA